MIDRSKIITLLISIGFLVPIIAVSKILLVKLALNTEITIEPILLGLIGMLPIYLLDRIGDSEEDEINDNKSERKELIQQHKSKILVLSVVLLATYALLNILMVEPWKALILHVHFLIFLIYSNTKQYILLDTVAVGVAWSTFILGLVTFYTGSSFSISIFAAMLIMKMGETELSNIRDAEADKMAGHPTLPVKFGGEKTIIFSTSCLILSFLVLFYFLSNFQSLIIGTAVIPVLYFYISYKNRSIEKTMYWDRLMKILIGLLSFILLLLNHKLI